MTGNPRALHSRVHGRSDPRVLPSVDYRMDREPATLDFLGAALALRQSVREAISADPQWASRKVPGHR